MPFDFPNAPTIGQQFAPAGGPLWQWDGTVWAALSSAPTGATAQSYNRIVNGAMQHSQENGYNATGALATHAGYYAADQWYARWSVSPGTASVALSAVVTPMGSANVINVAVVAAKASLAAGDYLLVTTRIEGLRIADLLWGTASAKRIVVRFWVYATVPGLYSFKLSNVPTANRCYVHQFTIPAANTWTQVVAAVPGDTTGTWNSDTNGALDLEIVLAVGSSFTGSVVDVWQAGNLFAGPGQINGMATAGTGFYIADVGLYLDPNNTGIAPPWVTPDYASELIACQRYYQRYVQIVYDTAGQYLGWAPLVNMRTNPSLTSPVAGFTVGINIATQFGVFATARGISSLTANARM